MQNVNLKRGGVGGGMVIMVMYAVRWETRNGSVCIRKGTDGTMNFRNGRIYFWGAVQLNRVLQKVKNKKKTKNILIIQLKNKFLYNENGISTHFTPVEYLS